MSFHIITGKTARLPGDWKQQPAVLSNSKERSGLELGFLRLWQSRYPTLPMPIRDYRFHATRKWELDFAWPDYLLAVEIDGGAPGGGRHQRRKGFNADAEKSRSLINWRVLRYTGDDLKTRPVQCVDEVAKILREQIE